ncbi:MAG: hypothetical protein ABI137_02405 [Antricoccus sp.]
MDNQLEAAAVVGPAALGREGKWSDIDLAFRLAGGLAPEYVVDHWTSTMYKIHDAEEHLNV